MSYITEAEFKSRFATLVIRWRALPQAERDLHILLISATLGLAPEQRYTERAINDELAKWTSRFGENFGLDHATLRRLLVDERYLQRDTAGACYEFTTNALPYAFDPAIKTLDLDEVLSDAWSERQQKREAYQASVANKAR